ncbi:MAG: Fic family protein [Actinomycetota bacterium]|nr:Fic family protein [Actinomycetota bacterium]
MRSFANLDTLIGTVPGGVVTRLSVVDAGRGSEALYTDQLPGLLKELADAARVESVIASSAIEGIVVEQARAERIVRGADQRLRVRNEKELAGYRDALDYLFQNDPGDLSVGLVLHLHRLLFGRTGGGGGQFKTVDNLVVDRHADGTSSVRFVPTSQRDTPFFTSELVDRYCVEQGTGRHHRVLLVGLLALDFLTIHPFVDGNGRLSRLLSTHLLSQVGYGVGRYVSLEGVIYQRRDAYYGALGASTAGWQEGTHDPWPWLSFFVDVVADAYEAFAARAADHRSGTTKQDRVRNYVVNHAGASFEMADVRRAVPGVSDQTVRLVLRELKNEGLVSPSGVGRGTKWVRVDE